MFECGIPSNTEKFLMQKQLTIQDYLLARAASCCGTPAAEWLGCFDRVCCADLTAAPSAVLQASVPEQRR